MSRKCQRWHQSLEIRQSTIYYAMGCLDDGTNESSTKSLMFQVFIFYTFYRLRALKTLYFYFCNFIKNKKINWKDFCKEFCKKSWKKKYWNIRSLVDDSFVPSSKQPSVIYIVDWRISSLHAGLVPWIHMIGEDISNNTNPSVQTIVNGTPFWPVSFSTILSEKKIEYTELYCFQKMSILL